MESLSRQLLVRFYQRYRGAMWTVVATSVLMNVLVFGGSLYLMLVYDMILPSRSLPTLFGLFGMLILVYAFQWLFENIRAGALQSIALRLHADLAPRVHHAGMVGPLQQGAAKGDGLQVIRALDQVYAYVSSPGPAALIDLPWVLVFLVVLLLLHVWLAVAALFGLVVMAGIAWLSSVKTRDGSRDLAAITGERNARLQAELRFAELATALGMRHRLMARSVEMDEDFRATQGRLASIVSGWGGAGRVFRMLVQSLILTVGALLVIDNKASGGIIIASSVLAGRALAPVDQSIAHWRNFSAARRGWATIVAAIADIAPPPPRQVDLPPPSERVTLSDVWVCPPGTGKPVVVGVQLALEKGQALAIIGPSGAGKTTLVRALLGIWTPQRGEIRFDGALGSQWDTEVLGRSFGYVPQVVELVEGTIGQNIARFDPDATSEQIIASAKKAGLHDLILKMDDGYDTPLSNGGSELSAGQRQRIGLARALYGDPFLLVLDEAGSNLDSVGDDALASAVTAHRNARGIVIMITHRPATLRPVSHVAVMNSGKIVDFGERDEVLKRTMSKTAAIQSNIEAA